jgi:hypothetical protein
MIESKNAADLNRIIASAIMDVIIEGCEALSFEPTFSHEMNLSRIDDRLYDSYMEYDRTYIAAVADSVFADWIVANGD